MTEVYSEMLEELFGNYEGKYSELLNNIPEFFNILQKCYSDENLIWQEKFMINCCFSYFAVPMDIIPDTIGPEGFLDDLYMCCYILKELIQRGKVDLKKYYSENLTDENILEVFQKTEQILGEKHLEILEITGLSKFRDLKDGLMSNSSQMDDEQKLMRIEEEIMQLVAILRQLFVVQNKRPKGFRLAGLKKFFSDKQWRRVENILEHIEIQEQQYDNDHEIEIDKIKKKVLLEIDEGIFDD